MKEHNHILKIARLKDQGLLPRKPGIWRMEIQHDPWCFIYADDYCNCDPDIYMLSAVGRRGPLKPKHELH